MENLIKYVNSKNKELLNSNYTLENLFYIIHNQEDRIFGEYIDNFKIVSVSYKDMKDYALKMANYLKTSINDAKDSYIGLYLENSINFVACFWGLILAGYKVALLNCKLPKVINLNVIELLNIKTIIASNDTFSEVKTIKIDNTNKFIAEVNGLLCIGGINAANEIAICSTATSLNYKVCIYNGTDLMHQVLNAKSIIKANNMVKAHYEARLKVLAFLPFYHIFGLIAAYFWFSIFGRTFVFLKDYAPDSILNTIKRHKVTHVFAVPILWNTIAKEIKKAIAAEDDKKQKLAAKWLSRSISIQNIFPKWGQKFARKIFKEIIDKTLGDSIKFLITGGGYVAEDTLKIINGIGYPLFNGYGSTEIGITSVELRKRPKYRLLSTVGKPFKSVQYKIEDDTLLVKGLSTCSKIITKDNVTDVDKNSWYHTNDIAKMDKCGYFYISGRLDDVYLAQSGEKYNPDLIEKKCLLTKVANYCILELDKQLSLIIQVKENVNALDKKIIKEEVDGTVSKLRDEGFPINKVFYT
ncbi:MAG: AMP-binding protein, partial [Bacilli bacterium]|nr:AMP-binding protein [Bacilli bacterium]